MHRASLSRLIAIGTVSLGSLAVAPIASAATVSLTALPANVKMAPADTLTLNVANASVCPGAGWTVRSWVPGRQDAVVLTGITCSGTTLVGTVTDNPASVKKNAVVKIVATNSTTSQTVESQVVVHLKTKGKP